MTTIQIPYPLVRGCAKQTVPEKELIDRTALADRIRWCAEQDLLGPHFQQVHLVQLEAPIPALAVFTFQSVPGVSCDDQLLYLIPLVTAFVEVLTDA